MPLECQRLDPDYGAQRQCRFLSRITIWNFMREPVLHILDTIKKTADIGNSPAYITSSTSRQESPTPYINIALTSDKGPSSTFIPDLPLFLDPSTYIVLSAQAEAALIKAIVVLCECIEENYARWKHVHMPIDDQALTSYHTAAMKRPLHNSRVTQIHRLPLYDMVGNIQVKSVQCDHPGMLHFRRLHRCNGLQALLDGLVSRPVPKRIDATFDSTFTYGANEARQSDRAFDFLRCAFTNRTSITWLSASVESSNHRLAEAGIKCHRNAICGRATIVLRTSKMEGGDRDEHVLENMWREAERRMEGEVLLSVNGGFGIAQCEWYEDATAKCGRSWEVGGCWGLKHGVVEIAKIDKLKLYEQVTGILIAVPKDEKGESELGLINATVTDYLRTSMKAPQRTYTPITTSSNGVPLDREDSPQQFIQAVHDTIIGYWELFRFGIRHCNIGPGDVLVLGPGQQFDRGGHDLDHAGINDEIFHGIEKKQPEVLTHMGGRGSTGILSDFDLCVPHSPSSFGGPPANAANSNFTDSTEANLVVATPTISSVPSSATFSLGLVRPRQEDTLEDARDFKRRKPISQPDDETATAQAWPNTPATRPANPRTRFINVRTGTLTFMSVRVTSVPPGEKYHHSFLDDLESFFWLIFWSAAAHLDDGIQYRTASAQSTLDPLTQQGPSGIAKQKLGTLAGCHLSGIIVRKDLEKFRNSWASDPVLTEVILKFGNLAFEYHFDAIDKETVLPADAFPKVIRIFQSALSHPQGCLLTDVY